jgi:hypothetical protein
MHRRAKIYRVGKGYTRKMFFEDLRLNRLIIIEAEESTMGETR